MTVKDLILKMQDKSTRAYDNDTAFCLFYEEGINFCILAVVKWLGFSYNIYKRGERFTCGFCLNYEYCCNCPLSGTMLDNCVDVNNPIKTLKNIVKICKEKGLYEFKNVFADNVLDLDISEL